MVGKDNGHRLNGCKIRTRYDALLNAYIRPFASDGLRLFYYCCSLSRTVVQTSGVFGTFKKKRMKSMEKMQLCQYENDEMCLLFVNDWYG